MPLTGSAKPTTAPVRGRKLLTSILDQLDSEWATLKQDSVEMHGEDEAGLLAYYHCCTRVSLHWIDGDPYTFQFPPAYQPERLAKLCAYLTGLQDADPALVKQARERTLTGLRAAWPGYRDLAYPDMPPRWPHGTTDWECPPFSWEAIETLWDGDNWTGEGEKARTLFLPQFRYQETADFHLASLAVLYLNRQLRLYLTDLQPHPTDIAGRHA